MAYWCNNCPECDKQLEWAYCEDAYGEIVACPHCKAPIRAERSEEEDRDGNMHWRYEWWPMRDNVSEDYKPQREAELP